MTATKVTMVSETEFSVKGHGVHTAYIELTNALRKRLDIELTTNKWWRSADVTHIQTVGPYSLFYLVFGKGRKVVSAHIIPKSFVGSLVGADRWLKLSTIYLKWFYNKADLVLAVSEGVKTSLIEDLGVSSKVEILYNSIDMSRYRPSKDFRQNARHKLEISDEQFVVLGIGQVQPRKRVDLFIEAAKLCPDDTLFIWVGGLPFQHLGADYEKMKFMMDNQIANVRMAGIVDHKKVRDYLFAADAFYLPADQENHPMCVLEAAGSQLPIILNDIPEYDDTFKGHAKLVGDVGQTAREVIRLKKDLSYRSKRTFESEYIAKRFDSKIGAEIATNLYKAL